MIAYPRVPWVKRMAKVDYPEIDMRQILFLNVRVSRQKPYLYTTICVEDGVRPFFKIRKVLRQWGMTK
jgi:hypothetical protein